MIETRIRQIVRYRKKRVPRALSTDKHVIAAALDDKQVTTTNPMPSKSNYGPLLLI